MLMVIIPDVIGSSSFAKKLTVYDNKVKMFRNHREYKRKKTQGQYGDRLQRQFIRQNVQ